MEQAKNYRLMDLIDDIKKVDAMINLHSKNSESSFMIEQYKAKKEKLTGYLIDELVEPEYRSTKSFSIIRILIDKFYPNVSKEAQKDKEHKDLNEIEHALSA